MTPLAAFEAPEMLVGTEPVGHSATAHKIVQRLEEAIPPTAEVIVAIYRSAMVAAARASAAAIPLEMAAAWALVEKAIPLEMAAARALVEKAILPPEPVLERVPVGATPPEPAVAATRDWAAVEVERPRSYRKSEHFRLALLRNWRIFAF